MSEWPRQAIGRLQKDGRMLPSTALDTGPSAIARREPVATSWATTANGTASSSKASLP
jgi:hypothetical protein